MQRRNAVKLSGAAVLALAAGTVLPVLPAKSQTMSNLWDKTFPQSTRVDHQKLRFPNRYGITLSGDLYLPRDHAAEPLAAIVVCGPFGAVKEQASGLYAQIRPSAALSRWHSIPRLPARAAASRATSPRPISIPRTSVPRPMLLIHGEKAHSRYFSETAYAAAAQPKELLIVPGASHTDLYDQGDVIPFDKLEAFFRQYLA